MAQETKPIKTIRLVLRKTIVELTGTPELLEEMIQVHKLLDTVFSDAVEDAVKEDYGTVIELDNVIPFPVHMKAHPSNPTWGSE